MAKVTIASLHEAYIAGRIGAALAARQGRSLTFKKAKKGDHLAQAFNKGLREYLKAKEKC